MSIATGPQRYVRRYGLAVLLAAAVPLLLVLSSCSSGDDGPGAASASPGAGETTPAAEFTQKDDGAGGVTVEVTLMTADEARSEGLEVAPADPANELVFRVKLDTHSVDLSGYDLTATSVLRDSQGGESAPLRWEAGDESQHHREGFLIFERPPTAGARQLVILGLAGVPERVFRWETVPRG